MTREQVFSVFFIGFLVFILYHLFKVFAPFLTSGFWAFIVTFAFFPLYERLERSLKGNRTVSAFLMTFVIFAAIVVPLTYLILHWSGTAVDFYSSAKEFASSGKWNQFVDYLRGTALARYIELRAPQFNFLLGDRLTNFLLEVSKRIGNFTATNLAVFTKNLVLFFLHFLLMIGFIFLFFRNGRAIYQFVFDVIPMPEENKKSVVATLNNTFTAIIRGQFLTSLVQSIIAGLVFYFLGIKLYIFFGVLTFVASMIPLLGASIVWAPIAAYLFIVGDYSRGIVLLLAGFFGISLIDNFLKPLFIGGGTQMSVFLIFLGILGGVQAYGISGIFIGPVVLAVFFALVKIFHERYLA